jgi:HEAT repeat protein
MCRHAIIVPLALFLIGSLASGEEAQVSTKASVPGLVRALGDGGRQARLKAAKALRALGPAAEGALENLILAARGDPEPTVRAEATSAVIALGPAAASAVGEWLVPHADRARVEKLIGEVGPPAVPMLAALTRHRAWFVRRSALGLLAKLGPDASSAVPAIIGCLEDTSSWVRLTALMALHRTRAAVNSLYPIVAARWEDESSSVRRGAVALIGKLDEPVMKRREFLLRAVREGDAACRHIALAALRRRGEGDEVTAAFRTALADPETKLRTLAAVALVERGVREEAALAPLWKAFSTHSMLYQWPVGVRGRRNRRSLRASGCFDRGLKPIGKEEIIASIVALGKLALPALREELEQADRTRRANAIWAFGKMPGTDDLIAPRLADTDLGVRIIAAVVLAPHAKHAGRVIPVLLSSMFGSKPEEYELAWAWHRRVADAVKATGSAALPHLVRSLGEHLEQDRDLDHEHYRLIEGLGPEAAPTIPSLARAWHRSQQLNYLRKAQLRALRAIGEIARPRIERIIAGDDEALQASARAMLEALDRQAEAEGR